MPIDSVSIADAEKIAILHHEILDDDVGILIDLILLIDGQSLPIAEGVLGNEVERGGAFVFGVLGQQLPPLEGGHLDVLLGLGLGVLGLPALALLLLLVHLLLDLVLVLAEGADGLLVQLLLLGIGVGVPEEIQILDLHVDADLGRLVEVGQRVRGGYLLEELLLVGPERLLGL